MKKVIGILAAVLILGSLIAIAGDRPQETFYAGGSHSTSVCDTIF